MKRIYFAAAAAAVLSLAACSQKLEINEPATFEITASTSGVADTRTTVGADWNVSWESSDALAAVINTKAAKFTFAEGNKFTTTGFTPEEGTEYTWNILYPYDSRFTSLSNGYSANYVNIPNKTNTQSAANDNSHLGKQPLYGYVETTTGSEQPTVVMKHLTTVIAVEITNTGSDAVTVKNVKVANDDEKDMSGTFYVKCSDGTIKSSSSAGKVYTFPYTNLAVTNGEIAANETATYYVPSAEFALEAGKNVTITLSDANGNLAEFVKPMTAPTTFKAGKIKTTKISLSSADFSSKLTNIADLKQGTDCTIQGTVMAEYARGNIISDESGSVLLYLNKISPYKLGDILKISGTVGAYNKGLQYTNTATVTAVGSTTPAYPEPVVIDAAEAEKYIALTSAYCKYAALTGKLSISGSYYNVIIDGTSKAQGSVAYPTSAQQTALKALNGKNVVVKGYTFAVSGGKYINMVMTEVAEYVSNDPTITAITGETSWEWDNTDAHTLTVEGTKLDGKEITVTGNTHFNVAVSGTTLTVTPAAALGEADAAVTETITVAVADGNSLTVTLTHKKKAVAGESEVVYTLDSSKNTGSNTNYGGSGDITVDNITWNVAGNLSMQPWRIGGKSITNTNRAVYTKTALNEKITKIVVTHGTVSGITVNSMTLTVHNTADDAKNGTNAISTLSGDCKANSAAIFEADTDWSNKFYRIVYNVTVSGTQNKFVQLKTIEFYN